MISNEFAKSSHCSHHDCLTCVEAGSFGAEIRVRDSALEGSPELAFSRAAWQGFLDSVKRVAPDDGHAVT